MKPLVILALGLALMATVLSASASEDKTEAIKNKNENENSPAEDLQSERNFGNPFRRRRKPNDGAVDYDADDNSEGVGSGLMGFLNRPEPEPVTRTRTTTIKVTKTVTKTPVCMTVYKPMHNCAYHEKPPVKPSHPYGYKPTTSVPPPHVPHKPVVHYHHPKSEAETEKVEIEPSVSEKSVDVAAVEEVVDDDAAEEDVVDDDAVVDDALVDDAVVDDGAIEEVKSRSARYLSFAKATPQIDAVKGSIDDSVIEDEDSVDDAGRFIRRRKVVYVTKTIRSTKVKTVKDDRVTATLIASNCIPVGSKVPQCGVHGGKPKEEEEEVEEDMSKDI